MTPGIYTKKCIFRNRTVKELSSITSDTEEVMSVLALLQEALNTKFEMGESNYYAQIDFQVEGVEQQFLILVDKNQKVDIPIKVIPLIPSGKELFKYKNSANLLKCNIFRIENDKDNLDEVYISTKRMNRIMSKYKQGEKLTETDINDYVQEIADWTADMKLQIQKALEKRRIERERRKLRRFEYAKDKNKNCKKIVISNRAYVAIVAEALSRDPVETGGILLGQYKDGVWYVVESTDPGIETIHTTVRHEMDDKYHNHLYPVVSRLYEKDLVLLGLWHRHPGSLNVFSRDDNNTNTEYAKAIGNGAISFLLNMEPNAKLTCYYLDHNGTGCYYRPEVVIGDEYFEGTNYLELASEETLMRRKKQLQEEIEQSSEV